jgi:hypothetical protein
LKKTKWLKVENKQNQISAKLNLSIKSKYNIELQVFKTRVINSKEFDDLDEKNQVLPEYLEEFTTNFWEEFDE